MKDLENIVIRTNPEKIHVLDKDLKRVSGFDLKEHAHFLFFKDDKIYANSTTGIYCYDLSGKVLWKESEMYSDAKNTINYDDTGFYVVHSMTREEINIDTLDKSDIMGEEFYNTQPYHNDLWLAKIGYNGKVLWHKFLSEHSINNGRLLVSDNRIIIPYEHQAWFDEEADSCLHILDKDGNLLKTDCLRAMATQTFAILDNHLIYLTNPFSLDPVDNELKTFSLIDFKVDFSVPFGSDPRTSPSIGKDYASCAVIGDKVFYPNYTSVLEFDYNKKTLVKPPMINFDVACLGDHLVIDHTPCEYFGTMFKNTKKEARITVSDSNLVPIKHVYLPDCFLERNHGFVSNNSSILVWKDNIGFLINPSFKIVASDSLPTTVLDLAKNI